MPQHISQALDDIFARGTLPERVSVLKSFGPFRAGQVLTWQPADRADQDAGRRWCAWALNVRQGWLETFGPARFLTVSSTTQAAA
jgi:hypothetical protein